MVSLSPSASLPDDFERRTFDYHPEAIDSIAFCTEGFGDSTISPSPLSSYYLISTVVGFALE